MVIINFQICIKYNYIFVSRTDLFTEVSIWKVSFCHLQEDAHNFDTESMYEERVHHTCISTPAYIPNSESVDPSAMHVTFYNLTISKMKNLYQMLMKIFSYICGIWTLASSLTTTYNTHFSIEILENIIIWNMLINVMMCAIAKSKHGLSTTELPYHRYQHD